MMKAKKLKLKAKSGEKKLKTYALYVLVLSFALCLLPLRAAYAQALSLGLWPPLLEVMIQPGKSITQVYKLSNGGEIDLALTSKIVPFKPEGELGNLELGETQDANRQKPFLSWFNFQNAKLALGQKFLLPAGKEQEIVLKIKVPQNAPEDDYYATLLFETLPGVFLSQSASQTQVKIGTNLLLTVSKDGKPLKKAEIVEFKVIDWFDSPQFLLRIKNTGKAFFKPMGTITVNGWFGQKYLLDLLPENVLAGSVRQIQCQGVQEDSPSQLCQLKAKFLLGRYQAKVEFGLDNLSGEYTTTTTFWAFPLKLILGLMVAGAIIWLTARKWPRFSRG